MPYLDDKKANSFADSFKSQSGMTPLKKLFGFSDEGDPVKEALSKRQAKLNEMKDEYGDGSAVKY